MSQKREKQRRNAEWVMWFLAVWKGKVTSFSKSPKVQIISCGSERLLCIMYHSQTLLIFFFVISFFKKSINAEKHQTNTKFLFCFFKASLMQSNTKMQLKPTSQKTATSQPADTNKSTYFFWAGKNVAILSPLILLLKVN